MTKYLKFTVIFLAILIIILFSITIVSIAHKYKIRDTKIVEKIIINPALDKDFLILSFEINGEKLYLNVENKKNKSKSIKIYNIKNGDEIGEIVITE
tara:strand:+ start:160 stop:450 length:291 start_codon:yes stop_codon:yes gene_type:complete